MLAPPENGVEPMRVWVDGTGLRFDVDGALGDPGRRPDSWLPREGACS
jgi:hypothetical protein